MNDPVALLALERLQATDNAQGPAEDWTDDTDDPDDDDWSPL